MFARFYTVKEHFELKPAEIDRISDWADSRLLALSVNRKTRVRLRLLAEELLLRLMEHYGDGVSADAFFEKSFGRAVLRFEIAGAPFNPLSESGNSLGDWNSSLVTAIDMDPRYTYSWGKNVLRFAVPIKKMRPVLNLGIAIAVGVVVGILGKFLCPENVRYAVTNTLLPPLFDVWIRILNALSGPVVFLMVITTVLNTKQISRQGGARTYVIGRYFLFSFLAAATAILCAEPFFASAKFISPFSGSLIEDAADRLLKFVPENLFDPFIRSDTPQLLVLAFVAGGAIIVLGNRVAELKKTIQQINMVGLQLTKWVSLLVPPFLSLFLVLKIWSAQTKTLSGIWKPVAISVLTAVCFLLLAALVLSARMRVRPAVLLRKLWPDFLTVLSSGSLDDFLADAQRSSSERLGIDRDYIRICLPQGLVLYMPLSVIGILTFTIYVAHCNEISINAVQCVVAMLLAVLLFIATPPVPGANLLAYTVFFSWLGLPGETLIEAMFFDIVFGIVASAGNLTLLEIETAFEANRFGLLKVEKLRAPGIKKST